MNVDWWNSLEPQWRDAFSKIVFNNKSALTTEDIELVLNANILRFAGPNAPYPNMQFELTNISGIADLSELEILVISHQQIETIEQLQNKNKIKSLFLFNNKIKSLKGIETLTQLEQLYIQCNDLRSIAEIKNLTNLKELYVTDNLITSLDGITEAHADNLKMFYCKQNEHLKQKEIIRVEREIGIICK